MDNTEPHDSCNETSTPCTCFPTDEMVPVINVLGAAKKKTHLVTFENEWKPRNLMVRHAWDDVPLFFSGPFIFQVVEFSGSFLGGVKIAKITNVFARTSVSPFCAFTKSCLRFKLLELQLSHRTYQRKSTKMRHASRMIIHPAQRFQDTRIPNVHTSRPFFAADVAVGELEESHERHMF